MADDEGSIFAKAGFDIPKAKPVETSPAAAPAAGTSPSIFESAGFTLPDKSKPAAAAEPAWKDVEALENLTASGGAVAPEGPKKPGRGVWQAIKDYPAHVLHGVIDAAASPGNALASDKPSTTESLIGPGLGLAGLVVGGEFPRVGPASVATSVATKLAPSTGAVNRLVEAIGPENVPEMVNRLRENPRLTPADVSDPVRTMTQGLIDPAQPAVQQHIAQRVKERQESLPAATNSAYTEAMGATPDVVKMVEGLRQRATQGASDQAKMTQSTLDHIMGKSSDPYQVLQQTMKRRSEEAAPLYERALSRPVAWDERLQQFIDDPIVKSGIAKGIRIQRLESLAENKAFNPSDYAIKAFDEAGDPIIGQTPNMRTLNVVKKGLDAMVEGTKDPITGRLSEEGRAIDKVRSSFLQKLDDINPDYKAARQAWAGPSQAKDAYNRGLDMFQNRSGASGVKSTPEALASWFNGASKAEQDAVKIGARSALDQQMKASADPAAKAAALVNKDVNQAKLVTLFGKDQADKIVEHLNAKFEDPIGRAFDGGFDVLKNRSGMTGLQDRPAALQEWMKTATPEEVVAKRLGVRADIDQKIRGVKNQALAGQTITRVEYNQEKLRTLFGDKEANRLIRVMKDAQDEAATNAKLLAGSKTAETLAGQKALEVRKVGGGNPLQYVAPVAAEMLGQGAGLPGVGFAASMAAKGIHLAGQKAGQMHDLARNLEFAKNALATGPTRETTINALLSHPKVIRELKKSSNALTAP